MSARLRLGPYEPLLELASGGMATVYVARQLGAAGFQRLVVIKRVHRHLLGDREFRDMFIDEARVASLIRHPNVVSVSDVVEADGELFLVMDYVESTALSTLLSTANKRGERLPPEVAARIVGDVLAGMQAAHEATDMQGQALELVHRDVSPQNVLVGVDGVSRLIDFGIAKAAHRLTETRSGSLKGKLGYMSPEGAKGMPIDRRADIFAAGVVLHEALTGERLFFGANEFDTLRRVLELDPPPPSSRAPFVSTAVDAVAFHALARDPARRFSTASVFLEALERAIPFASARDVAATLERTCGARLAERRAELRALLESAEPPSFGLTSRAMDVAGALTRAGDAATSTGSRLGLASAGDAATSTGSRLGLASASAEPRSEGTESQIAASHDWPAPKPRLRRASLVSAMLGGAVLTLLIGGGLMLRGGGKAHEGAAGAGSAAPSAAATPAPNAGEVEILLTAEAPIESVRARGLRRVELDGNHARGFVLPWQGHLVIEATLEGGRIAVREIEMDPTHTGPLDLSLSAASPKTAASTAQAHSGSAAETSPTPLPASAAPRITPVARPHGDGTELHGNPYGQ